MLTVCVPTLFLVRSSAAVHSGMPTGKAYMGWWGDMGGPKQKGINSYVVSPFRQSPMRGVVSHWIFNGYKRLMSQAPYFAIPLGLGYALIEWGKKDNHFRNSKAGHIAGKFP